MIWGTWGGFGVLGLCGWAGGAGSGQYCEFGPKKLGAQNNTGFSFKWPFGPNLTAILQSVFFTGFASGEGVKFPRPRISLVTSTLVVYGCLPGFARVRGCLRFGVATAGLVYTTHFVFTWRLFCFPKIVFIRTRICLNGLPSNQF